MKLSRFDLIRVEVGEGEGAGEGNYHSPFWKIHDICLIVLN